jgi:hypothetical protein
MKFLFNPSVDSIDDVPSDFRALYEEGEGGKHVLKSDEFSKNAISAISGLSNALTASRAEARDLKTKSKGIDLSPLSEYGDSPESIAEKFAEALTEAGKGKKSAEDIERQVTKIKADLATDYETKLLKATERGDGFKGQLYTHLVTSEAMTALAEAGSIKAELALPFVAGQVKVSESEDGQFGVHVVDKAGDLRYSGSTSAPMSVKELVAEMKADKEFAPLWKSEAREGGGAPPEPRPKRQSGNDDSEKSPLDKINAGLAARKKKGR